MEKPTVDRETADHGYEKDFTPLRPTRKEVRALWGVEREQSPSGVYNVHKPFEGEGVKQWEMLLLRMGEVEAQISTNAMEIK